MSTDALMFVVVILSAILILDVLWEVFKIVLKHHERKVRTIYNDYNERT